MLNDREFLPYRIWVFGAFVYTTYLKSHRETQGITLKEVSEESGIPYRTLQNYEKGITIYDEKNYSHIKDVFENKFSYSSYSFVKRCITDLNGNIKKEFAETYYGCNKNIIKFCKEIVKSEDEEVKMSQAYGVISSRNLCKDNKHW